MQGQEQVQTVQFYKIQLMQKEREISDFQSKLKKIEFKHNRDLKQAKNGQERAKALLKQQKSKADKISKQANENQQQNKLLQLRLNQLKQEKDREILEVRAQYNSIKEQVRSYQRILPTHTFLTEIARSIDQLPTYEDIFINFRDKSQQYHDLSQKFQAFKAKNQELIRGYQQNQELLKMKKLEAERNFKDALPKIIEYQHQISDLKISNEQYQTTIDDLRSQLQSSLSKASNLQDTLRQFESQTQQMRQAFTNQLHNKQQQVRLTYHQQMQRYQQQVKSLSSRMDIKDNMYISQIHILEEEISFVQNKYQMEKEKYEELINQYKEEVQGVKIQFEKAKVEIQQIQSKNSDNIRSLVQLAGENQQLQERLRGSQKKILQATQIHLKETKLFEETNQSKIEEYSSKLEHLSEQYKKLKEAYSQLIQQRQTMKYENQQLRQQISNQRTNPQTMNNLDIPNGNFQYQQRFRRKSTDYDRFEEDLIVMNTQKQELYREKEKTSELIKKTQDIQTEKGTIKQQLETVKGELYLKEKEIYELQQKIQEANRKIEQLSTQISQSQRVVLTETQKLKASLQQNQKLTSQNQQQKQKISLLTKSINENELIIAANNKKQNFYKAQIESLEQQKKIILEQDKKNKELIKTQKDQLKVLKEQQSASVEKATKQIKELTSQVESIKQQREQLKNQFTSKEKSLNYQIAILKNNKDLEQKLKNQITILNQDLSKVQQQKIVLSKKYTQLAKEYQLSKKEIEKLELQNIQKDRQNEMISQSLNRERRQRTLRTVPSLQSLQGQQQMAQQQNFNDIYLTITRKQGEINILQRQISDLKEQIESLKISQANKIQSLQAEQNDYIQTIISMKMKCAQSQMRASQKQHLYNQIKKKLKASGIN